MVLTPALLLPEAEQGVGELNWDAPGRLGEGIPAMPGELWHWGKGMCRWWCSNISPRSLTELHPQTALLLSKAQGFASTCYHSPRPVGLGGRR